MRSGNRPGASLAQQLLLLQLVGVVVLVAVGGTVAYLDASRATHERATDQVVAVATTIADAPSVLAAMTSAGSVSALQPFAERVRLGTGVDFVTIMSPDGIRYSHPNPTLIGKPFIGNIARARAGGVLIETYTGTLGPSVRAVVPVFGPDHTVRGLVAVGIKVSAISAALTRRLLPLAAVALAALLVGGLGSVLISARLRRQTMGLAPAELGRVFASYQATLHAMREGLVLVGADGRVALCNDGAMRLLGLDQSPVGRPVTELGLPAGLAQALSTALSTDEPLRDEIHLTDTRVLVVNSAPVRSGRDRANVVTLRDHTDLQRLTGELNTTRDLAESLHAQAHEAANRLHTVISLVELGRTQEAIEFATAELNLAQRLTDQVVGAVAEPVLAALLLGKAAEASERGVELVLTEDSALGELDVGAAAVESRALVTVVGNLVDNAIDAAVLGRGAAKVEVTVRADGEELLLRVADTGPGVAPAARDAVFQRGWSSKPSDGPAGRGLGLALVGQAVRRSGGSVQLTDSAGGGAEFTVRLPLTRPVG